MHEFYSIEDFIQDEAFQQWVYSPNEANCEYWENFLIRFPSQRKKVEDARQFLTVMKFDKSVPSEALVRRMKSAFNAKIDRHEARQEVVSDGAGGRKKLVRSKPLSRGKMFYSIAASFLLLAVFGAYFFIPDNVSSRVFRALTFEKQKTEQGKQRQVILADNTHVWLNAGSELTYPKDFSEKQTREVYLEGEAFFDVAEDKVKPFVVHTAGIDIRVLGTSFNVRSYADDVVVETTLIRGSVSIRSGAEDSTQDVTLQPNQHARYRKDSGTISLEEAVDTENYIGWKNGWMIFDDKPFGYIRETLERWYDVTIVIKDESSLSCTFSAKFKDKTLQEVLEIFKNTEAINYRIEGKVVFIDGKLCNYEN